MKTISSQPLQEADFGTSAVLSRATGPNQLAQASSAGNGRLRALSEDRISRLRGEFGRPAPIPSLSRLVSVATANQNAAEISMELKTSVTRLLDRAASEDWSQRELAKRAGLSWGTWRRLRDGLANPNTWLPKLRQALQKLQRVTSGPDTQLSTLNFQP